MSMVHSYEKHRLIMYFIVIILMNGGFNSLVVFSILFRVVQIYIYLFTLWIMNYQ
jgi:hypothetical protein